MINTANRRDKHTFSSPHLNRELAGLLLEWTTFGQSTADRETPIPHIFQNLNAIVQLSPIDHACPKRPSTSTSTLDIKTYNRST